MSWDTIDWTPFVLSLKLSALTTVILFAIAIPLVFYLHTYKFPGKSVVRAIITLPMVLPPSVLGFYLLLSFNKDHILGKVWTTVTGKNLAFSFEGILLGSVIYSLPFMINPIYSSLENLSNDFRWVSYSMGKSKWTTYLKVLLPQVRGAIISAVVLSFAHTIGEFGVILMIGGNIPDETRVASIAIYHEMEALRLDTAGVYAGIMLLFSTVVLTTIYSLDKKWLTN